MSKSPFGSWTGREQHPMYPGVALHSTGGDHVLLCRVTYQAGKSVPRHAHEHTEQVIAVVDGEVEVTVGGETRMLRPGDVCVMNRGVEHELHTTSGVTFFEALSPVPLDHVADRERDLVLGPDGGAQHVER